MYVSKGCKKVAVRDMVCLTDIFYRVDILIKYTKKDGDCYIVSFHESNIGGKTNSASSVSDNMMDKPYSVIITDGRYQKTDVADLLYYPFSLSRGFVRWQLEMQGKLISADTMVVDTQALVQEINSYVTSSIFHLMLDRGLTVEKINQIFKGVRMDFSNYSITAYGGGTLNNLSLLLEVIPLVSNDVIKYKQVCEMFITTLAMYLPKNEWYTVLDLLQHRYMLEGQKPNNSMLRALMDISKRITGDDSHV